MRSLLLSLLGLTAALPAQDIVIYGGTSGGITAAIQAAREGRTAVLIEPTNTPAPVSDFNAALIERCARDMRRKLGTLTPARYFKKHGPLTITMQYEPPAGQVWDDERYAGDAYGSYAWGCNVVEIEVDPVTFEVTPTHVTAVAEIGKAIHPVMAEGQIIEQGKPKSRKSSAKPNTRLALKVSRPLSCSL